MHFETGTITTKSFTVVALSAFAAVVSALDGSKVSSLATAQVAALNKAYNPIGVTFTLANVSTNANGLWAVADGTDMDDMEKAPRQCNYSDLNLNFHTDLSGGVLGTCTLPSTVTSSADASQYWSDGCNVNANTMLGSSMTDYNQGMTAVHETGRLLGLLHTVEGYSCNGDGDVIADIQCNLVTGVDHIHNYMDYPSDECYEAFTPGQVTRIRIFGRNIDRGID